MSPPEELGALHGPIERSIGPHPRAFTAGLAIGAGLAAAAAAALGLASLLGLPDGRIALETVGVVVVAFSLLLAAGLVLRAAWRGRSDRLELRAEGLVRRSASLGTKHLRYDQIERLEQGSAPERVDVHGEDGSFLRLTGWEVEPGRLAAELETRRGRARGEARVG